MSNTYRRKQKWVERKYLGTFERLFVHGYSGAEAEGDTYEAWRAEEKQLTHEQHYARLRAEFHSDKKRFLMGVPRWYRLLHGAHANRLRERRNVIRGIRSDEWDNHLPDPRTRGMCWYF